MTKIPVPATDYRSSGLSNGTFIDWYAGQTLKTYADARVRDALEEAIELVEKMGSKPVQCADAIRRLMP